MSPDVSHRLTEGDKEEGGRGGEEKGVGREGGVRWERGESESERGGREGNGGEEENEDERRNEGLVSGGWGGVPASLVGSHHRGLSRRVGGRASGNRCSSPYRSRKA